MIVTPSSFTSLLAPIAHDRPRTFVFRGNELLLRESDLALPDPSVVKALDIAPAHILPVGIHDKEYCAAAWVASDAKAPAGCVFKGLRSLFGRVDEDTLAVAGRAFQIADWARSHQFCGVCGRPIAKIDRERAVRCTG